MPGRLSLITGICIFPLFLWIRSELDLFLPSILAWGLGILAAIAMGGFVLWFVKGYWKPKDLARGALSYLPDFAGLFLIPILYESSI